MGKMSVVSKHYLEKKIYTVGYECWLTDDEVLTDFVIAISPSTTPPLVAEGAYTTPDNKSIITYLSQGKLGSLYTVTFLATTTTGQKKVDELMMRVT